MMGCSCVMLVLKTVQCTAVQQQWLVAGWLGPGVTVRVKVRARAREWCFLFFFFKSDILVYISDLNIWLVRHPGLSWVIL